MGNYQDAHVQGCVDSVKCQNAHILFYLGFPNSSIAASLPNYQSEPKLSWKKSKRWPITISSQLNWSNLGHKHGSLADNQQTSNLGLLSTGIYSEWYKTTIIDANTRKKKRSLESNLQTQCHKSPRNLDKKSGKINICTIGN